MDETLAERRCRQANHPDDGDGVCACGAVAWYPDLDPTELTTAGVVTCPGCGAELPLHLRMRRLQEVGGPLVLQLDRTAIDEHRCQLWTGA